VIFLSKADNIFRWDRSLATIMTPKADMTVEAAKPQKRWNPPFAETLASRQLYSLKPIP
jgi:hypothetical protein